MAVIFFRRSITRRLHAACPAYVPEKNDCQLPSEGGEVNSYEEKNINKELRRKL